MTTSQGPVTRTGGHDGKDRPRQHSMRGRARRDAVASLTEIPRQAPVGKGRAGRRLS